MLHISVLSFSKWLQSYFKHFKTIMQTAHIWSVSEGNNVLFIGLNILAKCSHRADNDNRKKWHLSTDTDIVADISCIPNIYIYIYTHISFFITLQIYGHLVQLPVTERLTKLNLFCYFYYFIAKCWSLFCCIQIWFIQIYIYCYILNLRLYFYFKCIRSTHFFFLAYLLTWHNLLPKIIFTRPLWWDTETHVHNKPCQTIAEAILGTYHTYQH